MTGITALLWRRRAARTVTVLGSAVFVLIACSTPAPTPPATSAPAPKTTASAAPAPPIAAPTSVAAPNPTSVPSTPVAPTAAPAPASAVALSPAPAAVGTTTSIAPAVADFYRGKSVRIEVGFAAGGGYETYARAIARTLGSHIPGNPTVVVENLPGAGGVLAAVQVYSALPKDGTILLATTGDILLRKAMGQPNLPFEVDTWNQLGAPSENAYLCEVQNTSGFTSMKEAMNPGGREMILGSTGGTADAITLIVKQALDVNIKLVSGYGGSAPTRLAMQQGEVHGMCWNDWTSLMATSADDLRNGTQRVLLQLISQRRVDLPQGADAPTIYELARTEESKALAKAGIEDAGKYARAYMMAPGVPPERVLAVRQAFADTMKDPRFLADAALAHLEVRPVSADDITQRVHAIGTLPASVRSALQAIVLQTAT